jgi:hypothetical protein
MSAYPVKMDALNVENNIITRFAQNKTTLFCDGDSALAKWKDFANILISELPIMYENKENWWYIHHSETRRQKRACSMAGANERLEQEWPRLLAQGLKECPSENENKKKFWFAWEHPQFKSRVIVATLTFKRFLGEEDEDGNCKGQGLCPILWGLGIHADGLTYIHADFKIVKKEDIKTTGMVSFRLPPKGLIR